MFDVLKLLREESDLKNAYDAQVAAQAQADAANAAAAIANANLAAANADLKSEVDYITKLVNSDPDAVDPTPNEPLTAATVAPSM